MARWSSRRRRPGTDVMVAAAVGRPFGADPSEQSSFYSPQAVWVPTQAAAFVVFHTQSAIFHAWWILRTAAMALHQLPLRERLCSTAKAATNVPTRSSRQRLVDPETRNVLEPASSPCVAKTVQACRARAAAVQRADQRASARQVRSAQTIHQ